MLYHILVIIIFAGLAIAVVILFRRFAIVQNQRTEWQLKETEFMSKLLSEGNLKPGQLSGLYDFGEDRAFKTDVFKLKKTDNEPGRDEIHALILKEINQMSDEELREFYQEFKEKHRNSIK